ncbi:MAG: Sulfurtransferase [Candidatus Moranbacteria bacterium GW2011_GWE1_35_17]|nr:MAG: Sulfurtransferase [Candidatus Moranbacteria bacterium GW2011_GWE1_35_17]KKP82861.1 MAG: Sulfurtransferase [Candidatus Moranbacteria bacterium GW2011_GWF2_35_54]KKP84185.1 MAG: Sulfurtransferase [Candidatus Moranbacteria bacterium GW2011_GWF1_35_5]
MNSQDKKENKIIFIGMGLILAILLFAASKNFLDKKNNPEIKKTTKEEAYIDYSYITSLELNSKIIAGEPVALLDIRDSVNFEKNHIENSTNISPANFDQTLGKIDKNQIVVIIGYDYAKKSDVAAIIKKMKTDLEFKNVLALSGGIIGWAEEGNQIISGGNTESAIDWSKIDYIIPEQLKLALDNNYPVFILDTRSSSQYATGHIPGAINIPLAELEKRRTEISSLDEILVYGASTEDDFKAGVKLNDLGFLATYTLKGGFASWKEKNFGLER